MSGSNRVNGQSCGESIPSLLRRIDSICMGWRIWFDERHRFILYTPAQLRGGKGFVELRRVLGETARCYLRADDMESAFKFATRGVSIGQHLLKTYNGQYGREDVEAGDVECRLVRARVLIRRGRIDAAREEIDRARTLARQPSHAAWMEAVDEAYRDLP